MISDLVAPVALRRTIALELARRLGLVVTLTSGFRSTSKQRDLRARYEQCLARGETIAPSNPNPDCRYPANRPGDSSHEFGLSWDSYVAGGEPEWSAWTQIRQLVGFRVPPNDRVHAEMPDWRSVAAAMYRLGLVPVPPLGAASAPTSSLVQTQSADCDQFGRCYTYRNAAGAKYRCAGGVPIFAPNTAANLMLAGGICP